MDHRVLAQLQHAIVGGPAFEMGAEDSRRQYDGTEDYTDPVNDRQPATPGQPAEVPIAGDACKRFVLAGKAIFTLQGKDSRYTFKVSKAEPKPGSQYTQPAYFVSLLTGPDNLSDYTYGGLLNVQTGQVRITRASKYTLDSTPIKAFNWAIGRIWRGLPIDPATFYHIGRCARCGRALTVPSSIESGLGPECAGKLDGGI